MSPPDGPKPEPIDPGTALRQLDDEQFVTFVVDLWERRGWVVPESDRGPWYVDLLAHVEWPAEDRTLLRVHLPESDKPLNRAVVRHFIRTVQQTPVDQAQLVTAATVAQSVKHRAAEFGVDVLDEGELVALVDEVDGHDLLAEHVDHPIDVERGLGDRAPEPVVGTVDRLVESERLERLLARALPPEPTTEDLAWLSFTGFRVAFVMTGALYVAAFAAVDPGLTFWLVLAVALLATYGFLLPLLALDIYLVRRCEATAWAPTWLFLAPFLVVPAMLPSALVYWYRRRFRTSLGSDGTLGSASVRR